MLGEITLVTLTVIATGVLCSQQVARFLSKTLKSSKSQLLQSILIAIPYFVVSMFRVISNSYVPDEAGFIGFAAQARLQSSSWAGLVTAPNLEGFGGAFWSLIGAAMKTVEHFAPGLAASVQQAGFIPLRVDLFGLNLQAAMVVIWTIRLFVLAGLVSWLIYLAYVMSEKGRFLRYVPAVAITLPMFWWGGKLASPELIATAAIGIATLLCARQKFLFSAIFAGIAVGFKVSAGPAVAAILVLIVWSKWRSSQSLIQASYSGIQTLFFALVGFISMNLFLLRSPIEYANNFARVNPSGMKVFTPEVASSVVASWQGGESMTWDFVTTSGLGYWLGSIALAIAISACLLVHRLYFVTIVSVGLLLLQSMLIAASAAFSWYFFPAIAFMLSSLAFVPTVRPVFNALFGRIIFAVCVACAVLTSCFAIQNSARELKQVHSRESDMAQIRHQAGCIRSVLGEMASGAKFDLASMGYRLQSLGIDTEDAWSAFLWENDSSSTSNAIWVVGETAREYVDSRTDISVTSIATCGPFRVLEVAK